MKKFIFICIIISSILAFFIVPLTTSANYTDILSLQKIRSNSTSIKNYEFTGSFIYPSDYTNITSWYGESRGTYGHHDGVDFGAPEGSPIKAAASGYIEYAAFLENGYGNTIIIAHDDNTKTMYCHVDSNMNCYVGQYVVQGDIIGYVGPKYLNTGVLNGNTTGPHLHFCIYINDVDINPLEKL